MNERSRFLELVSLDGYSLSRACREIGISRNTGRMWRDRGSVVELSRRPLSSPMKTPSEHAQMLIDAFHLYEGDWGPRKLLEVVWPGGSAPMSERTAARILAQNDLRVHWATTPKVFSNFERLFANELWQMDFKNILRAGGKRQILSVVDDATRYCIALVVVPDQTLHSLWTECWSLFGTYGLPNQVLTDNGSAFRSLGTWRYSQFDLRLMRMKIQPLHGRPRHPQTQGKVERLHGTLEREWGHKLRECPQSQFPEVLEQFRQRYNQVRPHDSLQLKTPASLYTLSTRKRPSRLPSLPNPKGAIPRKVEEHGIIGFRGSKFNLGKSLAGQTVHVSQDDMGIPQLYYKGLHIDRLDAFTTGKDVLS